MESVEGINEWTNNTSPGESMTKEELQTKMDDLDTGLLEVISNATILHTQVKVLKTMVKGGVITVDSSNKLPWEVKPRVT